MDFDFFLLLAIAAVIALIIQSIRHLSAQSEAKKLKKELDETKKRFTAYQNTMEPLKKYKAIVDAEAEAKRIISKAKKLIEKVKNDFKQKVTKAKESIKSEIKNARDKAKNIREKADTQLQDAYQLASKIESDCRFSNYMD